MKVREKLKERIGIQSPFSSVLCSAKEKVVTATVCNRSVKDYNFPFIINILTRKYFFAFKKAISLNTVSIFISVNEILFPERNEIYSCFLFRLPIAFSQLLYIIGVTGKEC